MTTTTTERRLPSYILTAEEFAGLFGFKATWVYKYTQEGAEDRLPKCPGVRLIRINLRSPQVRDWVERRLGPIDWENLHV